MLPRFHLDVVCDGLSMSTKDRASTASSSPLWTQASTMQAELPANIRSPRWMYCNSYRISLATLQGDPVAADNSGLSVQGGIKQEPPTNFSCSRVQFKILVRTVNSRLWVFFTWLDACGTIPGNPLGCRGSDTAQKIPGYTLYI